MAPKNDSTKSSKLTLSFKSTSSSDKANHGELSAAQAALLVAEGYSSDEAFDADVLSETRSSTHSDDDDESLEEECFTVKDLDGSMGSRAHILDSNALLAKLGPSPSADEIASLAAAKAHEYIMECFGDEGSTLDKEKFDAIPRYVKSDLKIGQFLGKGSFSDAFEVTIISGAADAGGGGDEDLDAAIAAAAGQFGGGGGLASGGAAHHGRHTSSMDPDNRRRPRARRGSAAALSKSVCMGSLQKPSSGGKPTLAMKCLRPQIRADAEQFLIGVEDLIHETAILASLDHPNIIKIHGRSGGSVSESFRLCDGYFILLDRLTDTLEDRIKKLKKQPLASKKGPSLSQLRAVSELADAVLFLHRNNYAFRDLKPANVGFSENGSIKLFDFGFAIAVDKDKPNSLFEKCGTLRYMAPEVGLGLGYGIEADIFSFGIILWEICALKKPFNKVKSAAEFEELVFEKDLRPKLGKRWNVALKDLITKCWSRDPMERPSTDVVKSILVALVEETSKKQGNSLGKSIRSSIARRVTWD